MKHFYLLPIILIICYCNGKRSGEKEVERFNMTHQIDSLETKIYENEIKDIPNEQLTRLMISSYEGYANLFHEDTISAQYLYNAARLYENVLRDNSKAANLYGRVYESYPTYSKHSFMLFAMGNAYHSLGDTSKAVEIFNKFINEYSTNEFADDAKGMIKFMRMTKDEVDQMFNTNK